MICVPRRQRGAVREDDPGNQRVAQVHRPPAFLPGGHQIRGMLCCGQIEWRNPALDFLYEQSVEGLHQQGAPPARRKNPQPGLDLEDGDRCRPNRRPRLIVEPVDDIPIRRLTHQRREDVRIEHDHRRNEGV
jgi:hypothetical protein